MHSQITHAIFISIATGLWLAAVGLLAWSTLGGPDSAGRWGLMSSAAAASLSVRCTVVRAKRIICEVTSLQIRMHSYAQDQLAHRGNLTLVPEPRGPGRDQLVK